MRDKAALREYASRLAPPTEGESADVVRRIHQWLMTQEPTTVLTYLSMTGELPAERVAALPGPHVFATTRTPERGWLTIHPIDSPRQIHRLGYEQPTEDAPRLAPETIRIALVPGRVFDENGGRIGWGAGYYDELLGRLPRAMPVGITLERRLVDHVPMESHDIPMSLLITESRSHRVSEDVA